MERCRRVVLERVNQKVEDAIRDLSRLWDENQATVLSLLQDAMVRIAKHRHLEAIISSTIKELDKVRRLDPEKIRIAVSGTSGEAAVEATNKGLWARFRSGSTGPVSDLMASEVANQTGMLARFRQWFSRSRAPQSTHLKHSANGPVTDRPLLLSSTSEAYPDGADAPSTLDPENLTNLAVAVLPASLAKDLDVGTSEPQSSVPTMEDVGFAANTDTASKEQGVKDKGTVKLSRKVLYNHILSTTFYPVISRVKTGAQSCMTESLIEMAALAHRAAVGALEECYELTEKHMEAHNSKDTTQLQADTLERLICWGNLVAAQGAIRGMKQLKDEPVVRLTLSPSSTLLSPVSSFAGSPSVRSQSPSLSLSSNFLSPI